MTYLLISNLALLLFFLIYRFGLRKLTFFSLNRWYLLGSVVISYLLPLVLFIELKVPEMMQITMPVLDLTREAGHSNLVNNHVKPHWLVENWISLSYWLGVLFAFCWLGYRFLAMVVGRFSDKFKGSYSFLGKIKVEEDIENAELIYAHEQVHVSQRHSYDIMLIELIRIFNWFNPVLTWIRDELKFQHECIVDSHFSDDKVAYAELLVACAMNVRPNQLSHEFSNKSLLKDRINMIFKDKSKAKNKVIYLSILPMAVLLLGLIINCKPSNQEKTESTDPVVAESLSPKVMEDSAQIAENSNKTLSEEETSKLPVPTVIDANEGSVYDFDKVEIPPLYPGGLTKFRKDVSEGIGYPQAAVDAGVKGTIELSFVINIKGEITDIKVVKDIGHGAAEACVASLEKTKKWSPAIMNGKPVAVRYSIPIRMDLSQF